MRGCHSGFRLPRRGGRSVERNRKPAMSTGTLLAAVLPVLAVGALMCSLPAVTRPTLPFGVRVPPERAQAPVIRRARRAYHWRTAAAGAGFTLVAVTAQGHCPSWLTRVILIPELAAGLGCF